MVINSIFFVMFKWDISQILLLGDIQKYQVLMVIYASDASFFW